MKDKNSVVVKGKCLHCQAFLTNKMRVFQGDGPPYYRCVHCGALLRGDGSAMRSIYGPLRRPPEEELRQLLDEQVVLKEQLADAVSMLDEFVAWIKSFKDALPKTLKGHEDECTG